jgi:hypothetical protein
MQPKNPFLDIEADEDSSDDEEDENEIEIGSTQHASATPLPAQRHKLSDMIERIEENLQIERMSSG